MLDVGTKIEKYEVVAHLGVGGFADVYRARHMHLGSEHALKILKPEFVAQEAIRLRFLDEARVQARLDHPNIVRVTDIIAGAGIAGLVMELLVGGSLADEIDGGARPDPSTARAVFLPILDALGFAHQMSVVHRDVKPDNIFLARGHAGMRPKLLDFGIARVRGELRDGERRRSTVATSILGTPGYMSPEQLRSTADADARSDIFSLGVALLEYWTGVPPFDRDSEVDTIVAVMSGQYTIPAELSATDPQLAAVIRKALQPLPEHRFGDCAAFASALEAPSGEPQQAVSRAPISRAVTPEEATRPLAPQSEDLGSSRDERPEIASHIDLKVEAAPFGSFVVFDRKVTVLLDGKVIARGTQRNGISAKARVELDDQPRALKVKDKKGQHGFVFPADVVPGDNTLLLEEGFFGLRVVLKGRNGGVRLKRSIGWQHLAQAVVGTILFAVIFWDSC